MRLASGLLDLLIYENHLLLILGLRGTHQIVFAFHRGPSPSQRFLILRLV
jgi:hypothetical protein